MKFVVDTTQVAKGLRDYRSAVEGVFSSLDKFENHVKKTMDGVNKAAGNTQNINKFRKSIGAFSDVKIDRNAARQLNSLSQALGGFKPPTRSQTTNLRAFFRSLSGLPDLGNALKTVRSLNNLKAAMEGFRAPSSAQTKRFQEFGYAIKKVAPNFAALGRLRGISGIANELASISIAIRNLKVPSATQGANLGLFAKSLKYFNFSNLGGVGKLTSTLTALAGFKAPSAAQIRNLQSFITTLGTLKVPPNSSQLAASLTRVAHAASLASGSMGKLRSGLGPLGRSMGKVSSQANGARLQMMGLQNAFSGTFQIGSVLRSLLGTLTIAEVGRNFFEAANAGISFNAQMSIISKETGFAASQMEWITNTANKLGVDLLTSQAGFGKLAIAAHKTGLSVGETRHIFEGFGKTMAVIGTTVDRQNDVFLAMQQVMSKGYLSAEELNQQLNEHLPVARGYATEFAATLGLSLEKALKTKALDAADLLTFMADRMTEEFGPAVEQALNRPSAQMTILKNKIITLFQVMGDSGATEGFVKFLKEVSSSLTPEVIEKYAKAWGESLFFALEKVRKGFVFIRDNWDQIKGPLALGLELFAKYAVVTGALQIGKFFVTPLINGVGVLVRFVPLMKDLLLASRALAATNLAGYLASLSAISSPRIAGGVGTLSTQLGLLAGTRTGRGIGLVARGIRGIGTGARVAAPVIGRLAGVIGVGLTAAWATARQAATASNIKQVEVTYSAGEIIRGIWLNSTDWIRDLWKSATESITEAVNDFVANFGIEIPSLATIAAGTLVVIAYGFEKTFEAIGRGVMGAVAAIARSFIDLGRAATSLFEGDVSGAAAQAWGVLNGDAAKRGFLSAFQDFDVSGDGIRARFKDVGRGANVIADFLNQQGKRGRAAIEDAQGPSDDFKVLGDQDFTDLQEKLNGGDLDEDSKTGGSKRKGRSEASRANQILNDVRQLMGTFGDVDPIGQLYAQFVDTLHDQSQTLLNENGYKKFIEQVKMESKDGKLSVQSLINVLQQGGTVSAETMQILRDRYGKDVDDIIGLLRGQQTAFDRAVKDSIVQAMDFKHAAITETIDALGQSIPRIQQLGDTIAQLTPIARIALSNDEFTAWLDEIKSGTLDAESATSDLAYAIKDMAGTSPQLQQTLDNMGISAEELATQVMGIGSALAFTARQSELSNSFGGTLLRDLDQEAALLRFTDQAADGYRLLQQAVQDYLNSSQAEGPLTDQKIKDFEREIKTRQMLADELQRTKEHFENNGIRSYINDITEAGRAAQELDTNVLQSLEDQLFSLGTTGEFSFKAIFDTIQQGLVRFAAQDITSTLTESVFGGRGNLENGNPSIFGGLFGALGQDTGPASAPLGASSQIHNVKVVNSGIGINRLTGDLTTGRTGAVGLGDGPAVSDVTRLGGGVGIADGQGIEQTAAQVAETTTATFGDTMQGMFPLLGLAFASSFKSPIAQIGVTFGSMIIQKLLSSGGGGGGIGAGLGGGFGGILAGLFSEGGMSNAPVSSAVVPAAAFRNAPQYMNGTANTSGGRPAILHDNEAVVPLSRGRRIPVEMPNGGGGQSVVNNFNISTPDADSFKKSRQQVVTDMHMSAQRSFSRNRG